MVGKFVNTGPSTSPDTLQAETRLDKPKLGQMLVCSLVVGKPLQVQLQALFDLSVRNNRNRGLTGVLLCGNGVFVHWLEGLTDYLDDAWRSIAKDTRHEDIAVLWENRDAPDRLFGDWVMGLRNTIVAQDLLALLNVVKLQQSPKAMLRAGYYEVFSEAVSLLERVCMPQADHSSTELHTKPHKLVGPSRAVATAMLQTPFTPYMVAAVSASAKAGYHSELSSLHTDASSLFKNSVPMEHTALFDMAAEGVDDLLTLLDMPLRWALGRDLWQRRELLSDKPLHWTYEGKLVVVVDHKTWKVGMHPELTHVAYEQAVMNERLRSANDIPQQFRQTTAYALFWDYAQSDASDDLRLPARFTKRNMRIRLRRPPPVPAPTLAAQQQRLLDLLTHGPESLVDLAQSLGLQPDGMLELLRPFYAARCIETVQAA